MTINMVRMKMGSSFSGGDRGWVEGKRWMCVEKETVRNSVLLKLFSCSVV